MQKADDSLVDHAEEIRTQVLRELYERSRSSIVVLVVLVLLFRQAMVAANKIDGTLNNLFAALIGISVVRWLVVMVPTARREVTASVRTQVLVFTTGIVLTSVTLAALVVRIWPILDTAHLAILAAVISGIVSGAVMSLSASPVIYMLYMLPVMGAMFFMAMTDRRPPWGAELLAVSFFLYTAMIIVMTFDHARTRRRGIQLSLQLSDLVVRDALTQLHNRRFLHEYMAVEQARLAREATNIERVQEIEHDDVVAVYMVDLDHFKWVNDSHGHAAGDSVLKQLADVLSESVRKSDVLVRWGGEEFVLVARIRRRKDARILAENLRHRVEASEFRTADGVVLRRTCSIGFCTLPFLLDKPRLILWEQALGLADAALYVAKNEGRNRWVGVGPGATPWEDGASTYIEIRDDLVRACEKGTIALERGGTEGSSTSRSS